MKSAAPENQTRPAMMLNYLNEPDASRRILAALDAVYREGKHTTRDVGGNATTKEFTQAVIAAMCPG